MRSMSNLRATMSSGCRIQCVRVDADNSELQSAQREHVAFRCEWVVLTSSISLISRCCGFSPPLHAIVPSAVNRFEMIRPQESRQRNTPTPVFSTPDRTRSPANSIHIDLQAALTKTEEKLDTLVADFEKRRTSYRR